MKQVLNDIGYIEYVNHSGSEKLISKIAGISHQSEDGPSIKNLMDWKHLSPFEFGHITVRVKAPIFVVRQWIRHRTGHYLEKSLRYCDADMSFYIPSDISEESKKILFDEYSKCFSTYSSLVKDGVPKEQARSVLPVGLYTEFFFQMDLRNLYNFFKQRLDSHAQKEIRTYATTLLEIVEEHFPVYGEYIRKEMGIER